MAKKRKTSKLAGTDATTWYKDAVIYELHVRAFADSNNDGVGDFRGLTQKLDYLQDLGVTALWLLPFYPSPLKDDGYDIADYLNVHPDYGTLSDFRSFLREAHSRGLRVITELVINHTSDQHPWFQRARRAPPGSPWRDFYVWNKTRDKYREARIIFQDFESSNWTWDAVAGEYYWHRFYSHQPDLNFDNPRVRKAVAQVMDFWLDMGVDGLRLDAIPYLIEREGTNCENLQETHALLKDLRRHVDDNYENRLLLAEANQWPEDAAAYFGRGDECHMAFHFPVMPRLFMSVRMEDRFPCIDILQQTPEIPRSCQWALFLRNHDELTLEMVTDEDRDYMYRAYAEDPRMRINLGIKRRLAPLLDNLRRKIELMVGLLFSLPGTPVLYYGDEIGMGDNIYVGDRNGVRTPMQWSPDRNAGFSRANPQQLYLPVVTDSEYHYEAVNVEVQERNPHSLLWWYKRVIALRKRFRAFGRGTIDFLHPENNKVIAFVRAFENEHVLVVANLSRFAQGVDLDLSRYKGWIPTEVFGGTEFPAVQKDPYFVTLGPHSFYWFSLEHKEAAAAGATAETRLPTIDVTADWDEVCEEDARDDLEKVLPQFLRRSPWFGEKTRKIRGVTVKDVIALPTDGTRKFLTLVETTFTDTDPQTYLLVLGCAAAARTREISERHSEAAVAHLRSADGSMGLLYDALVDEDVGRALLRMIGGRKAYKGAEGAVTPMRIPNSLRRVASAREASVPVRLVGVEESNSSIIFGDSLILKVLRRIASGVHPDLEVGRYLAETARFEHVPTVAGAIEYTRPKREPTTLAILQDFVPNEGDAWNYTLDSVARYLEEALARKDRVDHLHPPEGRALLLADTDPPEELAALASMYLEAARLLGKRTAELHLALASRPDIRGFAPEPFDMLYQRSLYQAMRSRATQTFVMLNQRIKHLPDRACAEARIVLQMEKAIMKRFASIVERKITGSRIRIHGNYHLGQVLHTGRDFVIIDFEGEPARPLSERRLKRSPLRDVAGMLRSFQYAAYTSLLDPRVRIEDATLAERLVRLWVVWVSAAYLGSYSRSIAGGGLLPETVEEIQLLLDSFLLDKCLYEIGYELSSRPDWVHIPVRGVLDLVTE